MALNIDCRAAQAAYEKSMAPVTQRLPKNVPFPDAEPARDTFPLKSDAAAVNSSSCPDDEEWPTFSAVNDTPPAQRVVSEAELEHLGNNKAKFELASPAKRQKTHDSSRFLLSRDELEKLNFMGFDSQDRPNDDQTANETCGVLATADQLASASFVGFDQAAAFAGNDNPFDIVEFFDRAPPASLFGASRQSRPCIGAPSCSCDDIDPDTQAMQCVECRAVFCSLCMQGDVCAKCAPQVARRVQASMSAYAAAAQGVMVRSQQAERATVQALATELGQACREMAQFARLAAEQRDQALHLKNHFHTLLRAARIQLRDRKISALRSSRGLRRNGKRMRMRTPPMPCRVCSIDMTLPPKQRMHAYKNPTCLEMHMRSKHPNEALLDYGPCTDDELEQDNDDDDDDDDAPSPAQSMRLPKPTFHDRLISMSRELFVGLDDVRLKCSECERTFTEYDYDGVRSHIKHVHGNNGEVSTQVLKNGELSFLDITCPHEPCNEAFQNLSDIVNHLMTKHDN